MHQLAVFTQTTTLEFSVMTNFFEFCDDVLYD
jgi:hypothetical protein